MNIALIFAGGVGRRMHSKDRPKQFLLVHGKPIIVHTIERFQQHEQIDGVVVACVEPWLQYLEEMVFRYRLSKVGAIVPGGATGQLSIYEGLCAAQKRYGAANVNVLIHDGVRPLVDEETISANVRCVEENGTAITTAPVTETVVLTCEQGVERIVERSRSLLARAPQSFRLEDILAAHERALSDGLRDFVDSCTLMSHYGYELRTVAGNTENIKVTTPEDFYMFRAIYDMRENEQLNER